jgi:hypothetical protein
VSFWLPGGFEREGLGAPGAPHLALHPFPLERACQKDTEQALTFLRQIRWHVRSIYWRLKAMTSHCRILIIHKKEVRANKPSYKETAVQTAYQTIEVTPREHGFGASISSPDLAAPLPAKTLEEIKAAWARHSVLAFPDQPLTHEQLESFTLQLGEFGVDPFIKPMEDHPHILELRREPNARHLTAKRRWPSC